MDDKKSTASLEDTLKSDYIFVCVPTPMKRDGSQDTKFIEDFFKVAISGPIYIIKSTVVPGTTNSLIEKYKNLDFILDYQNREKMMSGQTCFPLAIALDL